MPVVVVIVGRLHDTTLVNLLKGFNTAWSCLTNTQLADVKVYSASASRYS